MSKQFRGPEELLFAAAGINSQSIAVSKTPKINVKDMTAFAVLLDVVETGTTTVGTFTIDLEVYNPQSDLIFSGNMIPAISPTNAGALGFTVTADGSVTLINTTDAGDPTLGSDFIQLMHAAPAEIIVVIDVTALFDGTTNFIKPYLITSTRVPQ